MTSLPAARLVSPGASAGSTGRPYSTTTWFWASSRIESLHWAASISSELVKMLLTPPQLPRAMVISFKPRNGGQPEERVGLRRIGQHQPRGQKREQDQEGNDNDKGAQEQQEQPVSD